MKTQRRVFRSITNAVEDGTKTLGRILEFARDTANEFARLNGVICLLQVSTLRDQSGKASREKERSKRSIRQTAAGSGRRVERRLHNRSKITHL
jgi:hypothetical protein